MKPVISATVLCLLVLVLGEAFVGQQHAAAQQKTALADTADLRYYDSWPGRWYRVDGEKLDSLYTFEARKGTGSSYLETWFLTVEGQRVPSFGLRGSLPRSLPGRWNRT